VPTNEDRRYANKEEIDQAYQEIRAEMLSLTGLPHSLYRDNDVVETIGTQTIFKIDLERRIAETIERILRPNGKPVIGKGACNVAENLIFARSELPSFDWPISLNDPNAYKKLFGQNKRYSDLASAILNAQAMILLWFRNVKLCLLEESSDEISLESVRESFNESFPFCEDDWDLLRDRWRLEYSQLLRDLPSLPGREAPPSGTRKGIGGRPRKGIKKESNRELLISILLKHHRYNLPDKDLNTDPISTEDACKQLGWGKSVLSKAWPAIKEGLTYRKYELICGNYRSVKAFLEAIDSKEGYLERTNNEDAIGYAED
jgi:hypothetical protein